MRIIETAKNSKRDPVRLRKAASAPLAVIKKHCGQLRYTPPGAA
jgi:hypothetical protein